MLFVWVHLLMYNPAMPEQTTDITADDISKAVKIAGITGYSGKYMLLGGGEVNHTFALECGGDSYVLRIAKYADVRNLGQEANALGLLNIQNVPKLVFFNEQRSVKGRLFIVETMLSGTTPARLDKKQLVNLGKLLANIHNVRGAKLEYVNFWQNFLDSTKFFGTEKSLLNHSDKKIKKLVTNAQLYFRSFRFADVTQSLIHGDVTASNMLVNGDDVSLIDWEFAKFKDPMADFSTMFYDDMEYNHGKWRIKITQVEKDALFSGYANNGGVLDENRLRVWQNLDKLGSAIYLYWKLNQSGHEMTQSQKAQYELDLNNLVLSLQRTLY